MVLIGRCTVFFSFLFFSSLSHWITQLLVTASPAPTFSSTTMASQDYIRSSPRASRRRNPNVHLLALLAETFLLQFTDPPFLPFEAHFTRQPSSTAIHTWDTLLLGLHKVCQRCLSCLPLPLRPGPMFRHPSRLPNHSFHQSLHHALHHHLLLRRTSYMTCLQYLSLSLSHTSFPARFIWRS